MKYRVTIKVAFEWLLSKHMSTRVESGNIVLLILHSNKNSFLLPINGHTTRTCWYFSQEKIDNNGKNNNKNPNRAEIAYL